MEADGGTNAVVARREPQFVVAPKDYFLGPVFAATRQIGPREVTISDRRYLIGGFHPLRPDFHPPALDVRHARAIFALLSFRRQDEDTPVIRFSFNEFCRKYAHSNGGRYARAITEIVADLLDAYVRVTDLRTSLSHEYRLIERIDIETRPPRRKDARLADSRQKEMWFNGCTLSPEFYGLLNRIAELQHVNLDVFTSIRSALAQAIYLYIPSRAVYHSEANPFEISVTKLLEQVSFPVPAQRNRRRQLLTQNRHPIIEQLDGIETLTGRFRVRLAETNDGTDWKLQAWVEPFKVKPGRAQSKLIDTFLAAGHTEEEVQRRLANSRPLSEYETDLLTRGEIEIAKNRRFFELARALLRPEKFTSLLAEAKGEALEGRRAKKSPTARLIWRIMEAAGEPVVAVGGIKTGVELRAMLAQKR